MTTTHPTKEQVRYWQQLRNNSHLPPPTLEEIRQQLGWKMLQNNRRS